MIYVQENDVTVEDDTETDPAALKLTHRLSEHYEVLTDYYTDEQADTLLRGLLRRHQEKYGAHATGKLIDESLMRLGWKHLNRQ